MLYLGRHQDKWDEMLFTPDILVPAIEELPRWTTLPVPTRTTTETVEVAGNHTARRRAVRTCPSRLCLRIR